MSARSGHPSRGCCGAGRCQFAFAAFFLIAALCMASSAVAGHYEAEEDPRAKRVAEYDDVVSAWTGTHRAAYATGNGEDGYLTGVDNLISLCERCEATLRG